jgi:membrane-associated protein
VRVWPPGTRAADAGAYKETVDAESLIRTLGYLGIFGVIFAETGLLFGLFLPGDTLLIAGGVLAARGVLNIWLLLPLIIFAAVAGNMAGYGLGQRFGRPMLARASGKQTRRARIRGAEALFQRHGAPTVILARFVPFARTFVPLVAGVGRMRFYRFMLFNIIGAVLWVTTMVLAGYFLGDLAPRIEHVFAPTIIGAVVVVVLLVVIWRKPWRH